ncbi:pantetheine-phosphate adenylyltransferase, partial [Neisseria sp. P0021.S007]
LMPPREIAEVSSTMVKGLVGPQGWRDMIGRYLPDPVYQKILQDHETNT